MQIGVTLFLEEKFHRGSNTCHSMHQYWCLMRLYRRSIRQYRHSIRHIGIQCGNISAGCENNGTQCGNISTRCSDISACYSNIGAWHGIFDNIGDCGVGETLRMCNRVTNPLDIFFPDLQFMLYLYLIWLIIH